jgi:Malonyl-CoA decarboxylase C-terminal domain
MMTRRMPRVCKGLSGLQTGRQLLHSAIGMLHKTHPKRRLATLSPIPGFRRWLRNRLAQTHSAATLRLHERPGRQMLVERLLMSEVEMASGASLAPASLHPCAVLGSRYGVCVPSARLTEALQRHTSCSVMRPIGRMRDLFADQLLSSCLRGKVIGNDLVCSSPNLLTEVITSTSVRPCRHVLAAGVATCRGKSARAL